MTTLVTVAHRNNGSVRWVEEITRWRPRLDIVWTTDARRAEWMTQQAAGSIIKTLSFRKDTEGSYHVDCELSWVDGT